MFSCRDVRQLHQETPAQRDAAEAGAQAARLAAADGKTAQEQIDAAAIAAGRAATNGGMDAVGAEEASRKAATCLGVVARLWQKEGQYDQYDFQII